MGEQSSETTEVEIFGAVYHVRGNDDRARLEELARVVDAKMQEIADRVATVDRAKIAILAALNLADELFQCRRGKESERIEIKEKAVALTARLTDVLEG